MKLSVFLQLAAFGSAFIIPNQEEFESLEIQDRPEYDDSSIGSKLGGFLTKLEHDIEESLEHTSHEILEYLEPAAAHIKESATEAEDKYHEALFDVEDWSNSIIDQGLDEAEIFTRIFDEPPPHPPHPPGDARPPHHPKPPGQERPPPHHRRPPPHHRRPHHGHKTNKTVYELIAGSKYTTKLAKLINKFPEIVEALNGTTANFTVFAPTDRAFDKIPKGLPKPSKELLEKVLLYHVSPQFYPAGRVLVTRTIPSLLAGGQLGKKNPQRLRTAIGLKGLTVNFYSRIVAIDIFGTNGVIHGVDSLLIPPPSTLRILDLLPSEFSTLNLGLTKTGLYDDLNVTRKAGGTLFAPSNWAFQKLGPRINGFLFSPYGQKYLKALLEYHVVPDRTLYSDAYYGPSKNSTEDGDDQVETIPRGRFHFDLPTLLKDRSLSVDVARLGRLIEIKINAFNRVSVSDGVARDGVIHGLSSVLIPPRQAASGALEQWNGETELTQEDLMERLEPFVEKDDEGETFSVDL